MGQVVKRISLDPARADPGRLDRARGDRGRARADPGPRDRQLDQPRGRPRQARPRRAAREGARRGADRADHRRGRDGQDRRPQARDRPAHPRARLRRARPRPRGADLRRAHLHADHRRRRVEAERDRDDRGHPRASRPSCPGVKTSLGVSNVSFGVSPPRARGAELGLPAPLRRGRARPGDGQPQPHHALRRRSPRTSASWPTTSSSTAARTRSSASSATSSPRARRPRPRRTPTRPRAWSPRRRCTGTSCAARRTASRTGSTASVEKIGAVPTLNEVLLPAMKEVGDKFGAGELILPFVLQSAEVMKRAVAQLENYLDRIEGHTKGTVVIATVFGDVHDIGKSLVNTILTNNGYTVVDLGKQVPISNDHRRRGQEHEADGDRPVGAARLDLQADAAVRPGAARARARVPGADRRRRDQPRLRPPHAVPEGQGVRRDLRAGRLLLQGRLRRASPRWTSSSTRTARERAGGQDPRRGADAAREGRGARRRAAGHRRLGALDGAHRRARSRRRRSGACARSRSTSTRSIPTSTATCCSSCTGAGAARRARTGAGSSRATTTRRASRRAWSACGASRTTCTRARCSATSRATPTATS